MGAPGRRRVSPWWLAAAPRSPSSSWLDRYDVVIRDLGSRNIYMETSARAAARGHDACIDPIIKAAEHASRGRVQYYESSAPS